MTELYKRRSCTNRARAQRQLLLLPITPYLKTTVQALGRPSPVYCSFNSVTATLVASCTACATRARLVASVGVKQQPPTQLVREQARTSQLNHPQLLHLRGQLLACLPHSVPPRQFCFGFAQLRKVEYVGTNRRVCHTPLSPSRITPLRTAPNTTIFFLLQRL